MIRNWKMISSSKSWLSVMGRGLPGGLVKTAVRLLHLQRQPLLLRVLLVLHRICLLRSLPLRILMHLQSFPQHI